MLNPIKNSGFYFEYPCFTYYFGKACFGLAKTEY